MHNIVRCRCGQSYANACIPRACPMLVVGLCPRCVQAAMILEPLVKKHLAPFDSPYYYDAEPVVPEDIEGIPKHLRVDFVEWLYCGADDYTDPVVGELVEWWLGRQEAPPAPAYEQASLFGDRP